MAVIDREQLLADEKVWLPEGNVLTDAHMEAINAGVIAYQIPADDDTYYSEALCKGLRGIGLANNTKFQVDQKGIKKDKIGSAELEKYEDSSANPWGNFVKSLSTICPLFGYFGISSAIGMKINPSDKHTIDNEATVDDLVDVDISCPGTSNTDDLEL